MLRARTRSPVSYSLPPEPPAGIALFDLDGTLLAWDCQLLFRHFIIRREPWRALLLPIFLMALPFAGMLGTDFMKRVFLSFLWRMPADTLARHSRDFAKSVLPAIYPELRERLERHQSSGHLCILASASPQCYATEIGRELGFDISLGTEACIGRLLPPLENHKGPAKVIRLKATLPTCYFQNGKLLRCHGYTDSCADLPMLALCDSATVVNPSRRLTRLAKVASWEIVGPRRPWKTRAGFALRVIALLLGVGRNPAGIPAEKTCLRDTPLSPHHAPMNEENSLWKASSSQWLNLGHFAICLLVAIVIILGALYFETPAAYTALLVPLAYAIWKYLVVKCQVFELTSERIRITSGVINQHIDEIELYRVKDSQMIRPWWMRLTGLATISLETSDRTIPHLEIPAIHDGPAMREVLRKQVENQRDKKRVREMDFDDTGNGELDEFEA